MHAPADAANIHAYEYEDGPSPDMDNIAETWPIRKEDNYVEEILWERYKRLRTLWKNAQPKLTTKGVLETPAEHETQLLEESRRLGKESRQATHRQNKYNHRKTVLEHIVIMKSEAPDDDDLQSWKWLQ
ncbi:hypothetical protein EDD15DRAFT_2364585 [Pisolithus albus]|nr:hypothetical protein EDD15DRAFT_2364585 [Pisolithus albus]